MSDSLIKLIDASILPASLMVVVKFLGVVLVAQFFDVGWRINFANENFFSTFPVLLGRDLVFVSSFSDILMLMVILGGFTYCVLKALLFHDTHINPRMVARLASWDLLGLIKNSSKIYYSSVVWLIFSIISVVLVWINIVSGKTNIFVGIVGVLIIIITSTLLVRDIEDEISRAKKNLQL